METLRKKRFLRGFLGLKMVFLPCFEKKKTPCLGLKLEKTPLVENK